MNNKDEKTFADLFSSSTSEKEVEEQSFSSIFQTEHQETETLKEETKVEQKENKSITFDNIAESISSEKVEPSIGMDIFSKALAEEQAEKIKEPEETKVEKEDDLSPKEEKISFGNIFESPFPSSEISSTKEDITSEPDTTSNPFLTEESLQDEPMPKEETSFSDNPFFSDNTEKEESPKEKEPEVSNPFFTEEEKVPEPIINEPEEKTFETNDNPFFSKNEEPNSPTIDIKLPGESTETPLEKPVEESNPFFDNPENSNEVKESIPEPKKITEEKKEEPQPDTPKSVSPFFAEETKEESNNPFFQGQLNLVENKQHDKPISNIDITKSKHFDVKIVKKKEPILKFILGVFSYAIFIFLLLIGITLLIYVLDVKIRAAKGDYSTPTFNAYVVLTGSMLPEIEVNDVVITKKVEASKLKERDIITFASADTRFQGTVITHRIIKKNPPDGTNGYTFQTKGDNNNVADSALVPESNIYGKVILKIPKLGYLQEFLASDGGWIIVILIPCLTVISYDIVKLIKGLKRKKYKNIKVQK